MYNYIVLYKCVSVQACVYVHCACMYMYVSNRHVCLLYMDYFKEGKDLPFPL